MTLVSAVKHLFAKLSSQGSKPGREEKAEMEGPPIPHGWQSDMVPRENGRGALRRRRVLQLRLHPDPVGEPGDRCRG